MSEDISIKKARRRIQKDEIVAKQLKNAEAIKISSTLTDELDKYFTTSRDLVTGKYSYSGVTAGFEKPRKNMEKIAEVLLKIQAYRDRVIPLQCILLDHANTLTSSKRVTEEVIRERYSETLKQRGSLAMQDVFINSVIEPILSKREYVELFLKRCELTQRNLDNSYFTYMGVKKIGEDIINRAEGGRHSNVQ